MDAINREFFFAQVRRLMFSSHVNQAQVSGLTAILDHWESHFPRDDDRWLAYALATAHHETGGEFQPIEEIGRGRGREYGKIDPATGQSYFGRGFVQLTWKHNYQRLGDFIGLDLVRQPALALELPAATQILFAGMIGGLFSGKKLADYFHGATENWVGARKIVNGHDRAALIAGYGRQFYAAISYTKAH